jgi:hypothetical protein
MMALMFAKLFCLHSYTEIKHITHRERWDENDAWKDCGHTFIFKCDKCSKIKKVKV